MKATDFTQYLKLGWSVIPVTFSNVDGKIQKKVALPSWKEYQSRLATEDEIEAWVEENPDGVGIVTGEISGIVVVDVDTPETPMGISSPIVSKSGFSGGRHYYYRWSEGYRNTAKINGLPIDFRGDGGFVVAPPSKYGENMYTWDKWTDPMYLQTVPPEITSAMKEKKPLVINAGSESPYAPANEGERNVTASRVAGSIISSMSPKLWESAGWNEFMRWNENNNPPLGEWELRNTWDSIKRTHVVNHSEEVNIDNITPESVASIVEKRLAYKKLEDIAPSTGYPDLDKRIRGFVPGNLYTLSGDTNIGKTSIACNFAYRVGVHMKYKVLYFSLEPDVKVVDYLAYAATGKDYDTLTEEDYKSIPPSIDIFTKEQVNSLEKLIAVIDKMSRYDLIIVDHIGYFTHSKDQNRIHTEENVLQTLAGLAKKKQTAIMIIAHLKKGTPDYPSIDDIKGSSAFKQDSTDVLIVARDKDPEDKTGTSYVGNQGVIVVGKTKTGSTGPVGIVFSPTSGIIKGMDEFKFSSMDKINQEDEFETNIADNLF